MSQQSDATLVGNIYDLGYRHYDGPRLGRRHAMLSLYLFSLRAAFGLGRRATSKIIPFAIAIIALVPAVIQLGIAALIKNETIDIIRPENYFSFIEVTLALFCAAVAPEVVGRDQRTRTLSLYFSRALRRRDYTLAKLAALTTALLFLSLVPQAVLFLGNSLASRDAAAFWQDNWLDFPRLFVAGLFVGLFMASLSMAAAAQTARRAYATVAVIAIYLVTAPITATLVHGVGGSIARFAVFISPFDVLEGATLWIFRASFDSGSTLGVANFPGWTYGVVVLGVIAICVALLFRRYERISV